MAWIWRTSCFALGLLDEKRLEGATGAGEELTSLHDVRTVENQLDRAPVGVQRLSLVSLSGEGEAEVHPRQRQVRVEFDGAAGELRRTVVVLDVKVLGAEVDVGHIVVAPDVDGPAQVLDGRPVRLRGGGAHDERGGVAFGTAGEEGGECAATVRGGVPVVEFDGAGVRGDGALIVAGPGEAIALADGLDGLLGRKRHRPYEHDDAADKARGREGSSGPHKKATDTRADSEREAEHREGDREQGDHTDVEVGLVAPTVRGFLRRLLTKGGEVRFDVQIIPEELGPVGVLCILEKWGDIAD